MAGGSQTPAGPTGCDEPRTRPSFPGQGRSQRYVNTFTTRSDGPAIRCRAVLAQTAQVGPTSARRQAYEMGVPRTLCQVVAALFSARALRGCTLLNRTSSPIT